MQDPPDPSTELVEEPCREEHAKAYPARQGDEKLMVQDVSQIKPAPCYKEMMHRHQKRKKQTQKAEERCPHSQLTSTIV